MSEDRTLTWSYGGGTQSVALAVLVAQGKLPTPELVVIADTSREASETWRYTESYVNPLLEDVGLQVEVASHELSTVDLYSSKGTLLMPAYTSSGGKLPTFCSNEWKKRVVQRYLRSKGYGRSKPVAMWLGISLDEVARCKPSGNQWQEYKWPLIFDLQMSRADCVRVVREAGLPKPPKSSCWCCPYRQNSQWRDLRDNYPEDWCKAIELDVNIRQRDPDVFLHRSGVPLSEAELGSSDAPELALFGDIDGCDSGFCMV